LGGGPITKLGISALKIKKLHNKLDVIKKKQEQNILDYRRGKAERKVGEGSSIINKRMDRSVIKYKKLEIEENKIKKQLYKITKDGE